MLLWTGQAISEIGSAVTFVALPLAAVVLLNATTFQVGLLSAATTVCFLLVALPAGLIVDRVAKRRLMIVCDIARMLILGSVVVAAAFGVLTMAQLFAVGFLTGLATVFFDVAYQSYVPALVARDQLHDGNGKLGATQAFSQVAGPGLGGALFGLLKAGAMAADAISYAVSTATLLLIRAREPRPGDASASADRASATPAPGVPAGFAGLRKELFAGLGFVFGHPVLRKIAACTGTANLFGSISGALEILFLVRVVHVRPADTGLLIGVGSLGGILGGILSGRLAKWIGTARIIWFSVGGVRRDPDRHAAHRAWSQAGPVPDRYRGAELHRCPVQHRAAQLPPADLPAASAWPDERSDALDRVGHAPARRPARRRAGQPARHQGDDLGRRHRQLGGGVLGVSSHRSEDARHPERGDAGQ